MSSLLYTPGILAIMFGYQPPNEVTTPKYKAVGEARDTFEKEIAVIFADLETMESAPPVTDGYGGGYVALHARVSMAALVYAAAINDVVPAYGPVVHLSRQAIDAVTFARMWANKAIRAPLGPVRGRLVSLAKTESEKAQLAANASIALDAPVSEALEVF